MRGTILFIHGMSLLGHRDPRQVAVCRALATAGFQVVAPRFPALAQARIDAASPGRVAEAVLAISAAPDLADNAPIGLFSPSFSASLCLLAATRPALRDRVCAVCAVGGYADIASVLRFLMSEPAADPYGRLIIFSSLLHRVLGPCPNVERALATAIADDALQREPPALPAILRHLSPTDREVVHNVMHDLAWCGSMAGQVLSMSQDLVRDLDVLSKAHDLRCPVALVHGVHDNVIPASESARLHARLISLGRDCRLVITPLLGHGDQRWGPGSALPAAKLVATFAWYLDRIASAQR